LIWHIVQYMSLNMIREIEKVIKIFIKDKTKVACRMSGIE